MREERNHAQVSLYGVPLMKKCSVTKTRTNFIYKKKKKNGEALLLSLRSYAQAPPHDVPAIQREQNDGVPWVC